MATLYLLLGEFAFFVLMSGLFEYHWRNHDFATRTIMGMRIAYYGIAAMCFVVMLVTL